VRASSEGQGASVAVAARGGQPTQLFADLWLVHSVPGRPDETQLITSPVRSLPSEFAFAPIDVVVTDGLLNVRISGTIETGQTPTGERQLYFSAQRASTFVPAGGGVRDQVRRTASSDGSTKTSVGLPGADEVLSFELPPLQDPQGGTTAGRLSIRVRVTPRPMASVAPAP
jgi:hypothetical protein